MRSTILLLVISVLLGCAQQPNEGYPISPVKSIQVRLSDNFWLPKIKTVQNTTIRYALEKCSTEGRMDNFLIAGGEMEGTTKGAMPFDDTDVYKIIEGASLSLASSPDAELESYIDSVIAIIKVGQEEDGYLTTWRTIDPKNPPAEWVEPGERWEDLSMSHELYNAGHMYEAAVAHYKATGKRTFLDIALKNADLMVETFGPGKLEKVPGHQVIETGLIKLYQVTGKKKYLELAKFFLDRRGDPEREERFGPYAQDHKPVTEQDEVVGHAVRAVYMYAGMTDIAAIYKDQAYRQAVDDLWENMVYKKMYVTGGIGAKHEGESFGENYELPNLTAYSETCAAIGSVYWNHRLFLLTGDSKYYDIIERTLYNGLISGLSLDGTHFFYPNPLESNGEYTFNQGACTRKDWFDCSCCPTNMIRFIPSIPNLVYATEGEKLYINLFMANSADITVDGMAVTVTQETDYPWDGIISIAVDPESQKRFAVHVRIPGWAQNDAVPGDLYTYADAYEGKPKILVNGEEANYTTENGYAVVTRRWEKGDTLTLNCPMEVRRIKAHEKVEADRGKVALERGPIVYCAEEVDNDRYIDKMVIADDQGLSEEMRNDLLGGVGVLRGEVPMMDSGETAEIQLVPYYSWSNRGVGKMKMWFPQAG
ncbi:MAG: glycoside hydrolase family 127 protein [Candidatus Marinimicrobia bacterium]|nr:glycoside hydrolase family 127 protein [Candidatus Neomarinimicrobiota bacterium]MCF7829235.1 glycoside hydrolase family 127 protein [Candidatus Neomarinimicrobiota bacterium]MCF7881112.1 glycoside hydrolase family 127 protein [Candidatus Neomarinimicrobiota bacterium]